MENRKEYIQEIKKILEQIENGNREIALSNFNKLADIYPRSVGYDLCAEKFAFYTSSGYKGLYEKLGRKIRNLNEYPFVHDTLALFEEAAEHEWVRDYYHNLDMLIANDDTVYDAVDEICTSAKDESGHFKVCKELYDALDAFAYILHRRVVDIKYPSLKKTFSPKQIYTRNNVQMFIEDIDNLRPMILIETENYCTIPPMLLQDLIYLGIPVCYIKQPVLLNENEYQEIWEKTLLNIEKKDDVTFITPMAVETSEGYCVNNVDDVINYVKDEIFKTDLVGILAEMQYLEMLSIVPSLQRNFYKITTGMMSRSYRCLNYALYGDYLSYISNIYNENVEELIRRNSDVMFSIVIPARNSSDTLRYTIQTCLNQTYNGAYEIIISDNSTGENAAVYNLCKELGDDRIVYLKTPRELHLPKSFEFAYTHARGEYVFAIGSDDGLLPWALEEISKIIDRYPEEKVIQWERGFYAWPGFNGGQQNQLIIPRIYQNDDYEVYFKEGADYIAEVLVNPEAMYGLPMLYINSCFKRKYFEILLEKTGRLWDGVCQDIYMGVVTAAINPKILNIKFPMTIAGMSSQSVGANSNKATVTNEEFAKLISRRVLDGNVGGYYESYYEQLVPATGTDTYSLYKSILRAISIGLLSENYIDELIPWKNWYIRLTAELDIKDVAFDAKIHEMRYCASLLGKDFLEWFDEGIYEYKMRPTRIISDISKDKSKRSYEVGMDESGKRVYDASEYGVENIQQAVVFFSKMLNG